MASKVDDMAARPQRSRARVAEDLVGTLARFGEREVEDFGAMCGGLGSARVVLLGESTHGTAHFYRARAASTRRLIEEHAFSIAAVVSRLSSNPDARALVRCAQGSGSALRPRDNRLAGRLREHGLATFLFDLLKSDEEIAREKVFDAARLARSLAIASEPALSDPRTNEVHICSFGAGTGASSGLIAAVMADLRAEAVVSRGGGPDLAYGALEDVQQPLEDVQQPMVLIVVGGLDTGMLQLNCSVAPHEYHLLVSRRA